MTGVLRHTIELASLLAGFNFISHLLPPSSAADAGLRALYADHAGSSWLEMWSLQETFCLSLRPEY